MRNQIQSVDAFLVTIIILYCSNVSIIIVNCLFWFSNLYSLRVCLTFLIYVHDPSSSILKSKCFDNQTFYLYSFSDKSDLNWLVSFKVKIYTFEWGYFHVFDCWMLLQITLGYYVISSAFTLLLFQKSSIFWILNYI